MKRWLLAACLELSGILQAQQHDTIVLSDRNRTSVPGAVAATPGQIAGNWKIVRVENAKRIAMPPDKVSASFINFSADGHYQAHVIGADEKGDWNLSPQSTAIFMFANGMKTIWNILGVDANNLLIQKGVRGNIVTLVRG